MTPIVAERGGWIPEQPLDIEAIFDGLHSFSESASRNRAKEIHALLLKQYPKLFEKIQSLETRLQSSEAAKVRAFEAGKIAEGKVRAAAKALYQIRDFGSSKIEYDPIRRIAQQWFDYHGGNAVKTLATLHPSGGDGKDEV